VGRFHPLFIVTPGLRLRDLNLAAEALLRTDGEILVTAGQFCFADKARTGHLKACLDGGGGGASGWSYRRASGEFVVVHIEWLPSDPVDGAESLVALTFPPHHVARYVWAEFAHHFDLTRSEAAIVKRLVGGQTPTVVAEELGLSIETVRTHIRRTYNKLGISCREQLFSVIVPFRLG
jgi:DNA-binding CsgD family transcriptional regulator